MYEPKVIISEDKQSQYILMLYKEVIKLCEDNEPVNPFKSIYEEGEGIKIALNTTNDLPGAINYWDSEVSDKKFNYVIIGDPNPAGYKESILEKVIEQCTNTSSYIISEDWFMAMINITENNKLVVNKAKITIE